MIFLPIGRFMLQRIKNCYNNFVSRSKFIFVVSDLHATRILLAIAEMMWALSLFWPGETFGRPTYNGMAAVMDEIMWGWVFLISSLIQFYIVFMGKYDGKFANMFAAWNSGLWMFICGSMYLSVYPPPAAISGESTLMLAAIWIFARSNPKEDESSDD